MFTNLVCYCWQKLHDLESFTHQIKDCINDCEMSAICSAISKSHISYETYPLKEIIKWVSLVLHWNLNKTLNSWNLEKYIYNLWSPKLQWNIILTIGASLWMFYCYLKCLVFFYNMNWKFIHFLCVICMFFNLFLFCNCILTVGCWKKKKIN